MLEFGYYNDIYKSKRGDQAMRLIDADALGKKIHDWATDEWNAELLPYWVKDDLEDAIEDAPTVDAVKHGHWINKGFEPTRCSVCGITVDAINGIPWAIKSFKYCPYCGAKMDEVEDEID